MAPQDPLRQLMNMAEDVRRNIDSAVTEGVNRVRATVPALPFPGEGKTLELPGGPEELLAKFPELPKLPGMPGPLMKKTAEKEGVERFTPTGPRLYTSKEHHNSHTLSPDELAALKTPLGKDSVPVVPVGARVLTK